MCRCRTPPTCYVRSSTTWSLCTWRCCCRGNGGPLSPSLICGKTRYKTLKKSLLFGKTHTHTHTHIHTHDRTISHTCTCARIHSYTHMSAHTHARENTHAHPYTHAVLTHTPTHTHIHTHTHTHIYIYIYTRGDWYYQWPKAEVHELYTFHWLRVQFNLLHYYTECLKLVTLVVFLFKHWAAVV